MDEGPEWFAPKRYGFGSGLPISWQGWLLTVLFFVAVLAIALGLGDRPLQMIASLVFASAIFLIITAKTTRGGWKWRWGGDDE